MPSFRGFLSLALSLLSGGGRLYMIDALFNQPNYLAAKKMLDAVTLRQEAIANNIANMETPGYKRVDLSPSFETQLQSAISSGDLSDINSLKPTLAVDSNAVASSRDGNTVHLQSELMEMNENGVAHSLETQLVSGMLQRMQMAITGKD
jgi:flagellar basal-body rod protein FlgB